MIERMQIPAPVPEPARKPRQPLPAKEGQAGFQEMVQKADPKDPMPIPHRELQVEAPKSPSLQIAPAQTPMPVIATSPQVNTALVVAPQAIELHLDVQTGEREVVTLPWTLVANGLFGESVGRAGRVAGGIQMGAQPSASTGMQFGAAPVAEFALEDVAVPSSTSSESTNAVAVVQTLVRKEETETIERTRVEREPASALASGLWQKKLLRILENQGEGRAAVYYRDYGATGDELAQVIAHVRDLAERAGASVQRVVVNGTEVWSKSKQRGA